MKFLKVCEVCKQEFTTNSSGRVVCYICQPFSFSAKQKNVDLILPEIDWEEEGPTVKEMLEDKAENEEERAE